MVEQESFYKDNAYDFPDLELLSYSNEALRKLIQRELPMALDHVDGLGGMNHQLQIDHAQDLIDQARDILLDRGETFGQEDRESLPFLSWPLSPEEKEKKEAQLKRELAANAAAAARREAVLNKALEIAKTAMAGSLESDPEAVRGITLVISRSSWTRIQGVDATEGPSGSEVKDMIAMLHTLGAPSADLSSWGCSKTGVGFDDDPEPGWRVRMELPRHSEAWSFLREWHNEHAALRWAHPIIEVDWLNEGEPACSWVSLGELWDALQPRPVDPLQILLDFPEDAPKTVDDCSPRLPQDENNYEKYPALFAFDKETVRLKRRGKSASRQRRLRLWHGLRSLRCSSFFLTRFSSGKTGRLQELSATRLLN